jgi:hypothetical protein
MFATRIRAAVTAMVCLALLAGAASALAAHPKKSAHFSGSFGFAGVNGFKPPVSFNVSKDGKTLTGFTYSTLGCFGAGGFQKGVNYYTKPEAIINVGTVKVSSSGHFSASGVVWKYSNKFGVTTATTTLSGSFSKARAASGTVRFAQKLSGKTTGACESQALSFSAKAR